MKKYRDLLEALFKAAVRAADPSMIIKDHLPQPSASGRNIVIGAGKASALMAQALEQHFPALDGGYVITRYGHKVPCSKIRVVEASHPVPDQAGEAAAAGLLNFVSGLTSDDLVIALISGGGSALACLPADPLSLNDKIAINSALLKCGAPIGEMNILRKHLSKIKGGRLAQAVYPARLVSLIISDVPGDDLSIIASGPTVPDPSTLDDAKEVLKRYSVKAPETVVKALSNPGNETPKEGDRIFERVENRLIATPDQSLRAAAREAVKQGWQAHILGDAIEGEAREVAKVMAGMTRYVQSADAPFQRPCILLSGGETTVTVRGSGKGGRNVEFLHSFALEMAGARGDVFALAADTDGIDGAEETAGAVMDPSTLLRAASLGLDSKAMLNNNDSHSFFKKLGDQIITGPTLTNVNDFRAILIL